MSAIIGTLECLQISLSALVESSSGQDTLTKSAPSLIKSSICLTVAITSVVNVLVIDCTDIGFEPPIFTFPTLISLDFLLIMFLYGLKLISYYSI